MKSLRKIGVLFALLWLTPMESAYSQERIPIRVVSMNYPPLAAPARITGTLKIRCNLSPDGSVLSAEILEPGDRLTPHIPGKPVKENVFQWKFPSSANRSEGDVELTFSFDLVMKHDPSKVSRFGFDSPGSVKVTAEISDVVIVN